MSRQALSQPQHSASPAAPGWYGKVVMLGDFAHRRLPPSVVDTSDHWLSQSISASRVQLGSRWLDTYLTGPVWQFAWAPGIVDGQWWFGVLMPSVDAVGRYFPLLVCASDQNPPMSTQALSALSNWYAHASQAALGTLQAGASLESFEADLALAPRWQDDGATAPLEVEAAPKRQHLMLHGAPTLADWAQALAAPLLTQIYAGHSFWLASPISDSDDNAKRLTVLPGLPDPDQFSLMLEGRW
jgi:type VI secretion system protein ImpM